MQVERFYDIHCHAMNLSHPNLSAFIRRVNVPFALAFYAPAASILMRDKVEKVKNLLAVMENDMGSFFLLMEGCLMEDNSVWAEENGIRGLRIGRRICGKIILTPLLMDFGYKDMEPSDFYCKRPVEKPIVEQVTDVFTGIRRYIRESRGGVLEIYPFLGINTRNYTMEQICTMLTKYFRGYDGSYERLRNGFRGIASFDGNIEKLRSNCFSGIKLYPPLGFDPWPEDSDAEREKVELLYQYCIKKNIPVTVHCSDGGFIVGSLRDSERRTSPFIWEKVMLKYPELKINFAHMGKSSWLNSKLTGDKWAKKIAELILRYGNVYTDFSCCGFGERYYRYLKDLIESYTEKQQRKLNERIMFGSDYMINLLYIDSYNSYVRIFSKSGSLNEIQKYKFSCLNPERFLFTKSNG